MRWLPLLALLASCAARHVPAAVSPGHVSRGDSDTVISDYRQANAAVLRRSFDVSADEKDHLTDLTIAMQQAVAEAKRHPTAANKRAARDAIGAAMKAARVTNRTEWKP